MRRKTNSLNDKSFDWMWYLIIGMTGTCMLFIFSIIFGSLYFNYQMYQECTKSHNKVYCMNVVSSNNRISITEIKDEKQLTRIKERSTIKEQYKSHKGKIIMKTLVNVVEVEQEGFLALLGQHVMVFCANYIYAGTLVGVNGECIKLDAARIVYETGPFSDKTYKDAQNLPTSIWYIQKNAIESFGVGKQGQYNGFFGVIAHRLMGG